MRKLLLPISAFALLLGLFATSPALADSCSATKNCSDGSTVSCTGDSSCLLGSDYAQCDGQKTYCPSGGQSCTASYTCPVPEYDHDYRLFCSDPNGNCSTNSFNDSVTCGSTTRTCAGCQAGFYTCLYTPGDCFDGASCSSSSQCGNGFCTASGTCACP